MHGSLNTNDLRGFARLFVSRHCRLRGYPNWWRAPRIATAPADGRFDALTRIAHPGHLLPRQLLPTARAVVAIFLPHAKRLTAGNIMDKMASRDWALAMKAGNETLATLCGGLRDLIADRDYASALTPVSSTHEPGELFARWSHKHVAQLAGLGRLGHHTQLITPAGASGRLASFVTEAPLDHAPLVRQAELCLERRGIPCRRCVLRCPVVALTSEGLDREACLNRLETNRRRLAAMAGLPDDAQACGKCVCGVPCAHEAPRMDLAILDDEGPALEEIPPAG